MGSIVVQPTVQSADVFDANELRVSRVRALRGPNYWRLAPVVASEVRLGALEDVASSERSGGRGHAIGGGTVERWNGETVERSCAAATEAR